MIQRNSRTITATST